MTSNMNEDDGFCIKVYSPGNFIAKEITINGGVHLGNNPAAGGFTDEQIARARSGLVPTGICGGPAASPLTPRSSATASGSFPSNRR